ncbi:hypothetical protein [Lysinibacillus parviboronicapiens]|nr:hypothetical protein [Lysinibacillus parviboronicapiens]
MTKHIAVFSYVIFHVQQLLEGFKRVTFHYVLQSVCVSRNRP